MSQLHYMIGKKGEHQKAVPPNRLNMARLLGLARPYRWQLLLLVPTAFLGSTLTAAFPALLGKILDIITQKQLAALHGIIFLIAGLVVLQFCIDFVRNFVMTTIGEKMVIELRIRLYRHLQTLPLSFFQERRSGELLSRLTNDVSSVRTALTSNLLSIAQDLLTLLFALVLLLIGPDALLAQANRLNLHIPISHTQNIGSVLLIVAITLAPVSIFPVLSGLFLRKYMRQEYEVLAQTTAAAEETISNPKIVKAFTRESFEVARYTHLAWQQFAITRKRARLQSAINSITTLLAFLGLTAFLWYSGSAILNGSLSLGTLIMVVAYFAILANPLFDFFTQYNQLQIALGAADSIFALLDQPVLINDLPDAYALPALQANIRFEHVSFSYERGRQVLHDVTFEAKPGTITALVGPSGAGKTTIANLIPRFFDINSGQILVDGSEIRSVQLRSLREQIGIVLQEPVLFSTTIRENIAYGNLDASLKEIEAAAQAANATEFIEQLPARYDTLVGERGVKLSVGQRQRIAIARALLRNPRILILDEATSSLDNESEKLVQEALEHLMQNRTTIVIAHRLSTIEHADTIVVLEQGRVVEQGRHNDLLAHEGTYYRLYTSKFRQDLLT